MTHHMLYGYACTGKGKQRGQLTARLLLARMMLGLLLPAMAVEANIGQNSWAWDSSPPQQHG